MKIPALIFGLFAISSNIYSQKTDTIKIEVINCVSSITYSFDGDSVTIRRPRYTPDRFSSDKIDSNDAKRFIAIATKILGINEDEVLANPCVMDGFLIMVRITFNNKNKKLFIGNYYDERVDSLITVFDKYINRNIEILQMNAFRYPKSSEKIKKLIDRQKACDIKLSDDRKKFLLDTFCVD